MSTQKTTPMVPVTAADTADFEVDTVPARLTAVNLGAGETIPVYTLDGGVLNPVMKDGVQLELTETEPSAALLCAGDYHIDKGVTVAAAGVYLVQP